MYAPNYGFPNAAAGQQAFNGATPHPQGAHMPPGAGGPGPQQPPQPQQQMMLNAQQFPMGPGQGQFVGPQGPGMMPGMNPAMMQNPGMQQMSPAQSK